MKNNISKVKKGSFVKNPVSITYNGYKTVELPAGTEFIVWKVQRDGICWVSPVDRNLYSGSMSFRKDQLVVVDKPVEMPKKGDLFYSSWGYEQTNIDFYQVINVKNKSVYFRRIAGDRNYDGHMSGHTTPVKDKFAGESFRKVVKFDGNGKPYVKLTSYSHAWPAEEGKSYFFSEWH